MKMYRGNKRIAKKIYKFMHTKCGQSFEDCLKLSFIKKGALFYAGGPYNEIVETISIEREDTSSIPLKDSIYQYKTWEYDRIRNSPAARVSVASYIGIYTKSKRTYFIPDDIIEKPKTYKELEEIYERWNTPEEIKKLISWNRKDVLEALLLFNSGICPFDENGACINDIL
jgi:hypothetical protein